MKLIRRPWIWLLRVRHRKGYGVHSPSAYAFLRGVVYEDSAYYAYATLNRLHPWWVRWLRLYPITCRRLLFRLTNYAHPKSIILVGDCTIEAAYMAAAVPTATITKYADISEIAERPSPDLLFLSHTALRQVKASSLRLPTTLLIAEGIHEDPVANAAWHAIQADTRTGNTYDLYTYGIAFFNQPTNTHHYWISF